MDQSNLDALLRQRQEHAGFSVSNENVVLLPYVCETGPQVAAAFATTVTNAQNERCTVVLGYATTRRQVADRSNEADHYFLLLGNDFLEGAMPRTRAVQLADAATMRTWQPKYPVQGRFATLQEEYARVGRLMGDLEQQMAQEGDLLAADAKLFELQTVLGVMQLRASNLPQTREMVDYDSTRAKRATLGDRLMGNYAMYPGATIAPFMSTKSQPLIGHPTIQHALWTLRTSRVLVELKRRYRQANDYLYA